MKNWIQKGSTIDIVAQNDILSGDVVVVGSIAGIAVTSARTGETVAVQVEGIVNVPIAVGTAIPQGTPVFWDDVNKVASTTGTVQLGFTWNEAAATDTDVNVKLFPVAAVAPPTTP